MNIRHTWPALRVPLPHLPTTNEKTGLTRNKRVRAVVHRAQAAQIEEVNRKAVQTEICEGHLQTVRGWGQAAGPRSVKTDSKAEKTRRPRDEMSRYQGRIATGTTDDERLASWSVSVPQDTANDAHRSDNATAAPRRTKPMQQPMRATMESRKRPARKTWTDDAPMRHVGDITARPRYRDVRKHDALGLADAVVRTNEVFPESVNPQHSPHEGLELEKILSALDHHLRHELLNGG